MIIWKSRIISLIKSTRPRPPLSGWRHLWKTPYTVNFGRQTLEYYTIMTRLIEYQHHSLIRKKYFTMCFYKGMIVFLVWSRRCRMEPGAVFLTSSHSVGTLNTASEEESVGYFDHRVTARWAQEGGRRGVGAESLETGRREGDGGVVLSEAAPGWGRGWADGGGICLGRYKFLWCWEDTQPEWSFTLMTLWK